MDDRIRNFYFWSLGLLAITCFCLFLLPSSEAAVTREVVLLGKVTQATAKKDQKELHIVVTRQLNQKATEGSVQNYQIFSQARDNLRQLKIELWGETYLLGVCHATPSKRTTAVTALVIDLRCVTTDHSNVTKTARLEWKAGKKKAKNLLVFRSWLSGPSDLNVAVDYDAIRG